MQNEWMMGIMMPQVLYYLDTFEVTRRIHRVRGFSFTKGGAKTVLFYFSFPLNLGRGVLVAATPWSVNGILGKNTGVGSHSVVQGIFPTQGLNCGLLHCRQILHHLSYQGSPRSPKEGEPRYILKRT